MANEVINEDKIKKPTLTMKFLYELIKHNQHENYMLTKRVDKLEQQLNGFHKTRAEVAATVEPPILNETKRQPDTLIPRSERHPSPKKKKSIWSYWFRPHSF